MAIQTTAYKGVEAWLASRDRFSSSVSERYLQIAREQGLSLPITGLEDSRLEDPEKLAKQGWWKKVSPGVFVYRDSGGREIQRYAYSTLGGHERETIWTLDWGNRKFEKVERVETRITRSEE